MPKWMRHSNGNIVCVLDDAHVARILSEGGKEVSGPDAPPEPPPPARTAEEQTAIENALRAENERLQVELDALKAKMDADFSIAEAHRPRGKR